MGTAHDKQTLEDFAVKGLHLGKMTGVMVGAHAISDSFLLMHSGVGCKYKTAAQGAQHDLGEHPNVREAWTQVSEAHLVAGCSDRIGPFARAWWERRRSSLMVLVSAYFIELTGDDVPSAIDEVEKTLPDCKMVYIDTKAPSKGFFDGYAAVMYEAMKRMDWSAPPTQARQAAVMGHFFHRFENDTKADVAQIKGLIKAAGLEPGPMLFSGTPYTELEKAPQSRYILELPYTRPHDRKIRRLCKKRDIIPVDLPMGISGTRRFVRTVAEATGGDLRKVDGWLQSQAESVLFSVQRYTEKLRNAAVVIYADTPLAAGLVTIARELGMQVPLVGLRDQEGCLGGKTYFLGVLERNGIEVGADMEVLQSPSLRVVRERSLGLIGQGLSVVIGSTHELDVFRQVSRTRAAMVSTVLIETGFPSDDWHAVFQMPSLGFAGMAAWSHRILEAVRGPRIGQESGWF